MHRLLQKVQNQIPRIPVEDNYFSKVLPVFANDVIRNFKFLNKQYLCTTFASE